MVGQSHRSYYPHAQPLVVWLHTVAARYLHTAVNSDDALPNPADVIYRKQTRCSESAKGFGSNQSSSFCQFKIKEWSNPL